MRKLRRHVNACTQREMGMDGACAGAAGATKPDAIETGAACACAAGSTGIFGNEAEGATGTVRVANAAVPDVTAAPSPVSPPATLFELDEEVIALVSYGLSTR